MAAAEEPLAEGDATAADERADEDAGAGDAEDADKPDDADEEPGTESTG